MSSSRKSRAKRKRRSLRSNSNTQSTPEANFIKACKQLLNQLTAFDDSKPFHELISSDDTLYKEYKIINSQPISFRTIHSRLHSKPCHYSNYDEFNEDIKKIFYQEKRLKNFKGNNNNIVKKRIQKVKRVENYWNTLTASIKQYGFDNIYNDNNNNNNNKNKNKNNDDDNKEEEEPKEAKKKKESIKQKKNKKVLSNIKKRVQRSELESPNKTNKKRKLNDNRTERISTFSNKNKNKNKNINDDEKKEEIKQENDIYYSTTDSPYTPFANGSSVFRQVIGSSDELFNQLKVKKRLDFGDKNNWQLNKNINKNNKNNMKPMHTFEIKWRYENSDDVQFFSIKSERMDIAVKKFSEFHEQSKVKILSVSLTRHGYLYH